MAPVLARVTGWGGRSVVLDGCEFVEQLQAVGVAGGVAANVVPDAASVTLNYRFAPDRDVAAARRALGDLVDGLVDEAAGDRIEVVDEADGAPPDLDNDLLAALVAATAAPPRAKVGWTDVASFYAHGIPAANFGPGDPLLAHHPDERVERASLERARAVLADPPGRRRLSRAGAGPAAGRCYRAHVTDTAPKQPRPLEITAGAEPIKLGSMLLTVVEPRRGHEVAYNRWYERDHFYSGCMIGPYNFAGRRFVATADLKALRDPDPSEITGEPARGSYVAVYWVLDGYHDLWNRWAVRQVRALHAAGRMFEQRDHVHTLLYRFAWEAPARGRWRAGGAGPRPPLRGIRAGVGRPVRGRAGRGVLELAARRTPARPPAGDRAGLVAAFTPLPLLIDAPGDVPRQEATDRRTLLLWFLDSHPFGGLEHGAGRAPSPASRRSGKGDRGGGPPVHPDHPGHRHLHRPALGLRADGGRRPQRRRSTVMTLPKTVTSAGSNSMGESRSLAGVRTTLPRRRP